MPGGRQPCRQPCHYLCGAADGVFRPAPPPSPSWPTPRQACLPLPSFGARCAGARSLGILCCTQQDFVDDGSFLTLNSNDVSNLLGDLSAHPPVRPALQFPWSRAPTLPPFVSSARLPCCPCCKPMLRGPHRWALALEGAELSSCPRSRGASVLTTTSDRMSM